MIRLSYGTAVKMGLKRGRMMAEPTTAYIMLGEECISNCSFCAQRRDARRDGYLSRVLWLPYEESILKELRGFARVCFQTLDYPEVVDDLLRILPLLPDVPVSVSIVPISTEDMERLRDAGVDILSIALDAANPDVFRRVKGEEVGNRFTWEGHWEALRRAREVFREVNTHIIVGLGESDEDLMNVMQKLSDMGVTIALFAYTPLFNGEPPPVGRYRSVQLMRYLLSRGYRDFVDFSEGKIERIRVPEREVRNVLRGIPFLTSGCPGCNRPFYNERPGGTIYNYPRMMQEQEVSRAMAEIEEYTRLIFE